VSIEIMFALFTALFVSITSPLIVARFTNEARRREKELDWKREDLVAQRLEDQVREATRIAALSDSKLDQIHTLVNSNMTEARQGELDASRRELAQLKINVRLLERLGNDVPPDAIKIIEFTKQTIRKLEHELDERNKQTKLAEAQKIVADRDAAALE